MNSVTLIGRLTKDPEVRATNSGESVAKFTLAIDRYGSKEKQADFPRIVVFGKQAENCGKYLVKGSLVGVSGRIQTGSYTNKDGATVYTTDVVAQRVQFLDNRNSQNQQSQQYAQQPQYNAPPQQQYAQPPQNQQYAQQPQYNASPQQYAQPQQPQYSEEDIPF